MKSIGWKITENHSPESQCNFTPNNNRADSIFFLIKFFTFKNFTKKENKKGEIDEQKKKTIHLPDEKFRIITGRLGLIKIENIYQLQFKPKRTGLLGVEEKNKDDKMYRGAKKLIVVLGKDWRRKVTSGLWSTDQLIEPSHRGGARKRDRLLKAMGD